MERSKNSKKMKTSFPGLIFCWLAFCCSSPVFSTSSEVNFIIAVFSEKTPGPYFILAPSGLNLRATADPSSERLTTIPYGTQIELLEAAKKRDMMVDQFPGGMARVKYGEREGYVFDGYLSRFPAPIERQPIEKYVERIREARQGVMYEKCTRDWDGYYQEEEAITLHIDDWAEAFLVARQLFEIPQGLLFPKPSAKESDSFHNPDKEAEVWEDSMTVRRNEKGEIIAIDYFYRREGGGRSVSIMPDPQQEAIRLSLTLISD